MGTKISRNINWYWDQDINKYPMILRLRYQQILNDIETKISKDIETKAPTSIQWYWDQTTNIIKYQIISRPRYQQISKDEYTKKSTSIQWYWDQKINKYQMILKPKHQEIWNVLDKLSTNNKLFGQILNKSKQRQRNRNFTSLDKKTNTHKIDWVFANDSHLNN